MNTNQFYQALRAILKADPAVHVAVDSNNSVRFHYAVDGKDRSFCPITYVAYKRGYGYFTPARAAEAAVDLYYPPLDALHTMRAADRKRYSMDATSGYESMEAPDYRPERKRLLALVRPYILRRSPR